tara:strand:- start:11117 stop:11362 length:246 start_codon:yes stop_codon:yes gene_type:complete
MTNTNAAHRLENSDSIHWSLHRILAIHAESSGLRRRALDRYARSAQWTITNADLTTDSERVAAYYALHAVGEIVRLYPEGA